MQVDEVLTKIKAIQIELADKVPPKFKRYLFQQINPLNRLNVLIGARGVGKTTLLLQKYRDNLLNAKDTLYFSADSAFLAPFTLLEIGEMFYHEGGKFLLIDEIHHYDNWQKEVKTMYDSFPDLHLMLTGSSSLNIILSQFDLSRRSRIYRLRGLSFREFANLRADADLPVISLHNIFSQHEKNALSVKRRIETSNQKTLRLFKDYLTFGYYPYFLQGIEDFKVRLENSVEKVLYEDIPVLYSTTPESIAKLKKMLTLIATSSPFNVNIRRLSDSLSASKSTIYGYLDILIKTGLVLPLQRKTKGYASIRKPDKLYLGNPNLYSLLAGEEKIDPLIGSIRECFFANQVSKTNKLELGKRVDFIVENKKTEVGGKSKRSPADDVWTAKDGIEVGHNKNIPLYLFGFQY